MKEPRTPRQRKSKPAKAKPRSKVERGWTIVGVHGPYYFAFGATRKSAIERHLSDLGRAWDYCYAKGDRCVKSELRIK